MRQDNKASKSRDDGFALVVVLWIGVLLALMAAAFSASVRSRIRETAARAETVRAEALADAGVRIAILELSASTGKDDAPRRFRPDGTPVMCLIAPDAVLTIEVDDEEGKVSLNTSNEDLLLALFTGVGAPRSAARGYVSRIMDFRDSDQDARTDGAERDDYAKASPGHIPPKDADFTTLDELDQVLGIPSEIRDKAKPFLTTLSASNGVDPSVATRGLKAVLARGSNGIEVANAAATASFISSDLPAGFIAPSSRRTFGIRSQATLRGGARYVSEAGASVPNGAGSSVAFRYWRRGASRTADGPTPMLASLPPC